MDPRYEFRAFTDDFGNTEKLMQDLSPVPLIRESKEIYIVSSKTNTHNTKIRYDLMDIKALIKTEKGLEQWKPVLKAEFPLDDQLILDRLFPAFNTPASEIVQQNYSLSEFITLIVNPHPDLRAVDVKKKRRGFMVNNCICEMADVWIDGKKIRTAAVESTVIQDVIDTLAILKLDSYPNTNYLRGIKQTI